MSKNKDYGYVAKEILKKAKFDENGFAIVRLNEKWGFVDTTGKVVIPLEYDFTLSFSDGLATVKKDRKYGFVDTTGKVVIPLEYDYAGSFSEGLATVRKENWETENSYGFIDKTGKVVIPLEYDDVKDFKEGLAKVEKNGKWGFVDKTGKIVVPLEYDDADNFKEGLAKVKKNGKWGFVDKTGKVVVPLEYDYAYSFEDGLAKVKKDRKWGFVDTTGKVVVPLKKEGLAKVKKDRKWGFVNTTGKIVIPVEYDDAWYFKEGLARVKKDRKYGLVDIDGKIVVPLEYDYAGDFKEGLARVRKDSKNCLIDITGKIIIPLKYDSVEDFKEGLVKVKKDGKWSYLLNNQGEIIDKCLSITISIYGDAEEQDYAYLDKNKMKECLQCIAESDDIASVLYNYGGKNISIITGITYVGLICGKKFKDITDEDDFNEGNFVGKVKGFNTDSIDENEYGICWTNYSSIATFEYIIDDYPHQSLDEVDISQISINKDNRLSYKGKKYDLYDIDIESFNNDLCIYKGKEEIFCDDHYFHDKDNFLNFVREEFGIEVRHFNEEDDDFDEEDED